MGGGESEDKWERRMGICLGGGWGAEEVGASCSVNALGNSCVAIHQALARHTHSTTSHTAAATHERHLHRHDVGHVRRQS